MRYTKADVQWHSDGYRERRPAVNVKHYPDLERDVDWAEYEPTFKEWVLAELRKDDVFQTAWEVGTEICWEDLESDAQYIFENTAPNGNAYVKVWSQGRSGGWAVVDGLKDFDSWDAIDLAAWRKFERYGKGAGEALAAYMVDFLYLNRWDDYRTAVSADAMALVQS